MWWHDSPSDKVAVSQLNSVLPVRRLDATSSAVEELPPPRQCDSTEAPPPGDAPVQPGSEYWLP